MNAGDTVKLQLGEKSRIDHRIAANSLRQPLLFTPSNPDYRELTTNYLNLIRKTLAGRNYLKSFFRT